MSQDNNAASDDEQFNNDESTHTENAPHDENLEYTPFSDELDPQDHEQQAAGAQISADKTRIEELETQLAKTKDQMVRALAEAENARKRAQKDREDASKYAVSRFSKDLLSVADNLRRALDAVPPELTQQHEQVKGLTDGIEATERELLRSFEKNGIEKVTPLDQPFDPNFHEVMFEAPMADKPNGTIIQVIECGYTLNGRILRPARVGIAKGEATQSSPPNPGHKIDTEV
ncbi:MAG: nucleotide exchange factor GrpE [Alphaproteobacteria bacterium]